MSIAKKIAVQGCTVIIDAPNTGNAIITGSPSQKCTQDDVPIYEGNMLAVTVSNCSNGTCGNASGSGFIRGSSEKTNTDANGVIREDDESDDITVNGTLIASPHSACSFTVKVKVQNAGQIKTEGV